jgi:hypothetical protein
MMEKTNKRSLKKAVTSNKNMLTGKPQMFAFMAAFPPLIPVLITSSTGINFII